MIKREDLKQIYIPQDYNYIAVFLTLSCNLACKYCINLNEEGSTRAKVSRKHLNAEGWIKFLNSLNIGRDDLPITLQGGEPTLHKEFYEIVNGVRDDVKLDLLTNFLFDIDEFIARIDPKKFTRDAKYAAIRVSYHPGQNDIDDLVVRHHKMRDAGFYVGLYAVMTPWNEAHIKEVQAKCLAEGVDFRIKEYLGFDGNKWHGTYRHPEAISQKVEKYCECKTTELIVGPNGGVYRCHSDLYESRTPVSFVTDEGFDIEESYKPCFVFGHCNPCDIKVKTNRFQEFGHTSVDIRGIRELTSDERARLSSGDYGFGK
jgi:molybdenum cofactor biosynthesis enzyme MoaA